jgi:phosphoglycerate kinase
VRITTLDDIDVRDRTVLLRVDINSPIDRKTGLIADDNRLNKSLPTIADLAEAGAKVVIIAHQGDTLDYHNLVSMREHADQLTAKLGRPVAFIDDVAGPAARAAISKLTAGDILLLENIRILTEEVSSFENVVKLTAAEMAKTYLVRNLAPLMDFYVNDAFAAAHRNAPSLVAFQELLPTAGGRLLVDEVEALSGVAENPSRPCVFLLGGLKISDAFSMMAKVLSDGTADKVLTTGITANIMLMAQGIDLGSPSTSFITDRGLQSFVPTAAEWLPEYGDRIQVPVDLAFAAGEVRHEVAVADLPVDELLIDIGSQTASAYETVIQDAATIFVNGPAGMYESPAGELGTRTLWEAVAASAGHSVIGGGDTVASARRFVDVSQIGFVSTGGGALVRFLSGQKLPLLEAMDGAAVRRGQQ